MEKVIVLFSVPIFLLFVLLIVVFVLANYSGTEPAKGSPAEPTKTASSEVKPSDSSKGENNVVA
jgi:ABC-type microcin C transport system permease subunit YejB